MGGLHFFLIERHVITARNETLIQTAENISGLTEFLSLNYNVFAQSFYERNLESISNNTETYIILTDIEGNVLYTSENARLIALQHGIFDVSAFAGTEGAVVKRGIYNNAFAGVVTTAAIPLKTGDSIYGYALINSPRPPISRETSAIRSLVLISIAVAAMVSFSMSYILSAKISVPIRRLAKVADDFAMGEFQKRAIPSGTYELDELTHAFNAMATELEKNDDANVHFIANVSHDLRTPLTTIGGFVDGIIDGTIPTEKQEDYLKIVQSEAKRMSELISVFLDVSRYQMGDIVLSPSDFDINEEIRTVLRSYEKKIIEKDINVNLTFDTSEILVNADIAAIRRVLTNLADNAVKFVENGGEINITVKELEKKAEIIVENTGAVISPEDRKHIWERFYKSDKSRSSDKKGFGLGLFIVKNIVNQHGENIILQSGDNKTVFTFWLSKY